MKKKARLQVAVIGANGRMGQEIQKILVQSPDCAPFLGIVIEEAATGFSKTGHDLDSEHLSAADVWIDFSTLEGFSKVVKAAVRARKPLVSGVTGISDSHQRELKAAGKTIPVLWSPNLSFGIAALKKALAIAKELHDFDFQIEELHHRHKKDKPSGTALYLQAELVKHAPKEVPEPLAIRGGGIFGVHKVWMMSEEETLCLEHQALNRAVFAKGAVRAAVWLAKQKKGLYTMDDLFTGQS